MDCTVSFTRTGRCISKFIRPFGMWDKIFELQLCTRNICVYNGTASAGPYYAAQNEP